MLTHMVTHVVKQYWQCLQHEICLHDN